MLIIAIRFARAHWFPVQCTVLAYLHLINRFICSDVLHADYWTIHASIDNSVCARALLIRAMCCKCKHIYVIYRFKCLHIWLVHLNNIPCLCSQLHMCAHVEILIFYYILRDPATGGNSACNRGFINYNGHFISYHERHSNYLSYCSWALPASLSVGTSLSGPHKSLKGQISLPNDCPHISWPTVANRHDRWHNY